MESKYIAFISYNRHDTAWGKRLQRKLEDYRMPSTLCRDHGWDKKPFFKQIFFAPYDIQPNDLNEELKARLRASKNLIVICSPNSAKSEWVGREIEYFHSLGRADNIFFFIVDGEPNSNDKDKECYNPKAKELGLDGKLGVNVNEKVFKWGYYNRERAYIQLITKLLGIEFDTLWQRHRRQMIQNIIIKSMMVMAVMALLFFTVIYYQPIDLSVNIKQCSPLNDTLPDIGHGNITLYLPNDTVSRPIESSNNPIIFPNIPRRMINKKVRVVVKGDYFYPTNTTLSLVKEMSVPIERDSMIFGHIKFKLVDKNFRPIKREKLVVGEIECKTDNNGIVDIYVPMEQQSVRYSIKSRYSLQQKIIEMPCCVNDSYAIILTL